MIATPISLRITEAMERELHAHLFPGDLDEHGAVIAAAVHTTARGTRLLARSIFIATDGIDYVEGERGYRMLTADFVMDCVLKCADAEMAYLAVHCHRGDDRVGFSSDDLASHHRGYPALVDILDGPPAGGLVFARNAVVGDIWLSDGTRAELDSMVITGRPIRTLHDAPRPNPPGVDDRYNRQARLFGDRGQDILASTKVGIIGAGGAGSLINEHLQHLGVGDVVVVDPDRIEPSNLSRVVAATRYDTRPWLTRPRIPAWLRHRAERRRSTKVAITRRVASVANPTGTFTGIETSITDNSSAMALSDCDYLFLAADTMQARLVFNALVHQFLIPGVQVGAKAQVDDDTGELLDLFTVTRPVIPGEGCLWCNGLINAAKLQEEAETEEQRRRQRYVEDAAIPNPSVITLNAVATSLATNDFLMTITGLLHPSGLEWTRVYPRTGEVANETPAPGGPGCRECSSSGRLGRGPTRPLPTRPASPS